MRRDEYPFEKSFQARVLALLLRKPHRYLRVCEPRHFTNPIHMDLARIATEAYEKHGTDGFRLSRPALAEKVKQFLGKKRRGIWPEYRREIKCLFHLSLDDEPVLREQVQEFVTEAKYREALIQGERLLNARQYEAYDANFEEARLVRSRHVESKHYEAKDFQTPHLLHKVQDNKWLIDGFIPESGLTLLVGPPESAKSLSCLLWECAVVRGEPFLGLQTHRRTILHIDCENGLAEIKRRCQLFQIETAFDLLFWAIDDPKLGPPPQLPNPVYEQLAKNKWALVFDSLAFQTGGKVMSAEDVVPVLYELKMLAAKTGVPIVVIHHSSDKETRNQYLGSTFIRAALDSAYFVQTTKDPINEDRQLVKLFSIKSRRGGGPSLAMEIDFSTGTYRKVESPHSAQKQHPIAILARIIRKHPSWTQRKIIARSHLPHHKARNLLQVGAGKYWEAVPTGRRNQLRYELVREA